MFDAWRTGISRTAARDGTGVCDEGHQSISRTGEHTEKKTGQDGARQDMTVRGLNIVVIPPLLLNFNVKLRALSIAYRTQ